MTMNSFDLNLAYIMFTVFQNPEKKAQIGEVNFQSKDKNERFLEEKINNCPITQCIYWTILTFLAHCVSVLFGIM